MVWLSDSDTARWGEMPALVDMQGPWTDTTLSYTADTEKGRDCWRAASLMMRQHIHKAAFLEVTTLQPSVSSCAIGDRDPTA